MKFTLDKRSLHNRRADGEESDDILNEANSFFLNKEEAAAQAYRETLQLTILDYAEEKYEDAGLNWKTSNKKIAYVEIDKKTGDTVLVIPKGASGTAELTVTSKDSKKTSVTFRVVIFDTDVRLDTSSLTLNSYSESSGTLMLYPNILGLGEDVDIQVKAVKNTGTAKNPVYVNDLEYDIAYESESGTLSVQFVDAEKKAGKYTLTLEVTQTLPDGEAFTVYKTVKLTNKPALPKVSAKVTEQYNQFWKNASAKIQIQTEGELRAGGIVLEANDKYEMKSVIPLKENLWEATVVLQEGISGKIGTSTLKFLIYEKNYRKEAVVKANVKAVKNAPVLTIDSEDSIIYPELGEQTVQVWLRVPESIQKELTGKNKLSLTKQASAIFDITKITASEEEADLLVITLKTKSLDALKAGKTVSVSFTATADKFAGAASVTSKSLTISAKKLSTVKTAFVNAVNSSTAASYTLQQKQAEHEILKIIPVISDKTLSYFTSCTAADSKTREALEEGLLTLQQATRTGADGKEREVFLIKAAPELYEKKGFSKCKFTFTGYVASENGDGIYRKASDLALTLNLQKQKTTAAITATAKVTGSLNLVDPASSVKIVPSFKNLPQGARLYSVAFAEAEDQARYTLERETTLLTGAVTLTLNQEATEPLPVEKDSVELLYRYLLADGTIGTVQAKAAFNVVQTASVKAEQKSVALYNAVPGEAYGKNVKLTVTKPQGAAIEEVTVTGLEQSGISYTFDKDTGKLSFYVDPTQQRGIEKTYKAKAEVTLEHAGTKKGAIITYSIPMNVILMK